MTTPYEAELLTCLIEEAAETQKDACKALRFGLDDAAHDAPPSRVRIAEELGDVLGVMDLLLKAGIIEQADIDRGRARKAERLQKFLKHKPV